MKLLFGSLALTSAFALSSAVQAQSIGVDIYAGPRIERDYYYYNEAPPRTRYYVVPEREVNVMPSARNGCGEYRYWNGERCADARDEPPAVR